MAEISTIEEKKQAEEPNDTTKQQNFYKSMGASIGTIIFILIFGTLFMYTTKVVASNVIPNFSQSTSSTKPVDMFFFRHFKMSIFGDKIIDIGDRLNQRITFERERTIIETVLEYVSSNNIFLNFIGKTIESFFQINNYIFVHFFEAFYNNVNESFIIVIGGFLYFFVLFFLIIFNFCSMFLILMYQLFSLANNKRMYAIGDNHPKILKGITNIILTCIYYWIVIIFGPIISVIISSIMCVFTALYMLLSPLSYSYKLQSSGNSKLYGIGQVLLNLFTYKKSLIMILLAYSLIKNAGVELGTIYGVSAFIAVIMMLFVGVFNDTISTNSGTSSRTEFMKK